MKKSYLLIWFCLVVAMGKESQAQVFTPYQCGTAGTEFPSYFSADEFESSIPTVAEYANHTRYNRKFIANGFAQYASFRLNRWDMEQNYDYLDISQANNTGPFWHLTGRPNAVCNGFPYANDCIIYDETHPYWTLPIGTTTSLQSNPVHFNFYSDPSVTEIGFNTNKVKIQCKTTLDTTVSTIASRQRVDGVLMATNDVIFFKTPADSVTKRIHLWGRQYSAENGYRDFDIYAKCNANPTPTDFFVKGYTATSEESIVLPQSSCLNGNWHIAIHSYIGSGDFRLYVFRSDISPIINFDVGTYWNMSPNEIITAKTAILNALKATYGAWHGEKYIANIRFYNDINCSCGSLNVCELCLSGIVGRSFYNPFPSPNIILYKANTASPINSGTYSWRTLRHELGHYFGQPDEYVDGTIDDEDASLPMCGHTFMAEYPSRRDSFCYDNDENNNYADKNHKQDQRFPGLPNALQNSPPFTDLNLLPFFPAPLNQSFVVGSGFDSGGFSGSQFDSDGFTFTTPSFSIVDQ